MAALDQPDFKTIDFINQIFPNEASLIAIDPFIHRLREKIRQVDAEILAAVRQQSTSGSKAKEDLAAAMNAIQELAGKIEEIKSKAEQSELMVHEICRDIKKLDFAKKHITTTITAINRLGMLVLAVERLQILATNRQYKEAADQLEAVTQLCAHFETYKDVPKIKDLRNKFEDIKSTLRSHISSDFSSLHNVGLKDNVQEIQQLSDACGVVDALDASVRDELVKNFCAKELNAYQQIFQGTEVAKLEKVERRYSWIKRQLKSNEEIFNIFPPSWKLPYLLCMQFCKITRTQLLEILVSEKTDVTTLLQALESTLQFEDDLNDRFELHKESKMMNEKETEEEKEEKKKESFLSSSHTPLNAEDPTIQSMMSFKGVISSCFESHLSVYVDLEEKQLMDYIDKLILDETWEAEEGSQTNILSSSTQMFLKIRKSFNRCSSLSKNLTLFNLYKVFKRVLNYYSTKLSSRLPKATQNYSSSVTELQLKISEKEERLICFIVNTAEYCHETSSQLAESIQNRIDSQFFESIDVAEVQDEFSGVITRALSILVVGIETKLDSELDKMTRVSWATLESVGDQSEYVNAISSIFSSSIPLIAGLLSVLYFQFFVDKLAASFAPRFYVSIFRCKRISNTGAQQLLLDTHAVKTLLLEIPSLGGQTAPSTYSKYVNRELGKAESLLKVILSPLETIADTFRALLSDGNANDFQRILDLKGVRKTDQQPLLDAFSRKGQTNAMSSSTGSSTSSTLPPTSSSSSSLVGTTLQPAVDSASSMLSSSAASREAMIARATALGRGAMAQSVAAVSGTGAFKRIFALAESAKEKDMTFRKLFNA